MGGLADRVVAAAAAFARVVAAVATFGCAGLLVASPASAVAPPSPWDGTNPFNCTVQDAGLGATVPDPAADPYCVHFDKTHQNVSQLGVVDFLLKEPARTAAATPKCFYFQEDHWRGSLVQSDGSTVVYEFEGHYFFNKATGDGGAWVTGFTVAGKTFDPTQMPGFPPGYGRYFGPGTGGFITHNDVPTDPHCAALAQQNPAAVYAHSPGAPRCVPNAGRITRRALGPVSLGTRENQLRAELGPPRTVKRGFLGYCVSRGGALLVGEPGDRSGTFGDGGTARAVMILTTARGFVLRAGHGRSFKVGSRQRALLKAFPRAKRLPHTRAYRLRPGLVAGLNHGRVRYLAVYSRHAIRRPQALKSYLRRAR
jgi:hypothetical protein